MFPSAGSICAGTSTNGAAALSGAHHAQDRQRARHLAQVAQVIAEHDGNIDNIRMDRQSPDFTSLTIDLEVYDLKHLTSIIAQLRAKDVVAQPSA